MRTVIIFPGSLDLIFFINEIPFLKKYFNRIVVISYYGDKNKYEEIAKRYDLNYYMAKKHSWLNIFNINFFKWLFSKEVLREIKENCSFSFKGIKRFFYIIYYGLFYVDSKKFILQEIKEHSDNEFFLYSFWLSRGAYVISNFYSLKTALNIKKIVSRAHGYDLYLDRNELNYLPFRSYIDKNLDQIHFISEAGLKYYENYFSSNSKLKKFVTRMGTSNPKGIRKQIYQKDKITIVSCSLIKPVKRLDLIIDVLSEVPYDYYWIHIGSGETEKEVIKYATEKLPPNKFEFLGFVSNDKILDVYKQYDADFFINLSDSEGLPVSIMEAMSFGIPVIARNVGGVSEIVNSSNGLLLNEPLEETFCELIIDFMKCRFNDIGHYLFLSNNCFKTWNEQYNLEKNNETFLKRVFEE